MNNTNNSSNSKDYDEYVRSKVWRPFTTDKGGDYSKKSNNNVSQNRGSKFTSTMTDYTYNDIFYDAIVQEELHWFYPSFPQINTHSCGKSIFSGG